MSHPPYPIFNFNETLNQSSNPYEEASGKQFPVDGTENTAGDRLPPLEDVSQPLATHWTQFGVQPFSVHLQPNYDFVNPNHKFDESIKEKSNSKSMSASLDLLSNYRSKFKSSEENLITKKEISDCGKNLSTEEIVKLAAEKFIKFSTQRVNGYTMFTHPYGSSAFTSLSIDETREVELVFQLLTAAEKIGRKQFEVAKKFLIRCDWVASDDGTPVERLVFYLSDALKKRINKEIGIIEPVNIEKQDVKDENALAMGSNPSFLACHQVLPFSQVLQFTAIQAIMDQIGTSIKVHLIDVHIRSGVQWTALMQALTEQHSQLDLLKLTALATPSNFHEIEETGKRLKNFAISFNLPFQFKTLVLSDITDVQPEQLEVQPDEAVAVYCQTILRTMIKRPKSLENLMTTIGRIKPSIIVVAEVEANHNSTSFVNRFTETVFFYGAFFDCLEDCMGRDDGHRKVVERVHLAAGIRNTVAAEGGERVSRSVNVKTWRAFFGRFGMVELGLSESCLYQANLVLQQFPCGSSCTLDNNGKCLIVGWKGTPLHSLSTWKFI